jgi:hypothetical protein
VIGLITSTLDAVSGSVDIASALRSPTSTSVYAANYKTMTMSQLGRIVAGLHDQGDLSTSTAQTLINDLATAQSSCGNASRRVSALNKFIADTARLTTGTTANFLKLGAQPLTARNLPAANCK